MRVKMIGVATLFLVCSCASVRRPPAGEQMFVVMLGTGTPNAEPDRSGPALAVVVGDRPYIVDCGPGVVRQVTAAQRAGVQALQVASLTRLFITHLHSDHTAGYPDLILTPWVLGRDQPLEVYGPPGLASMTSHLLDAYAEDIQIRLYGSQPQNEPGIQVNLHEVEPGMIYQDDLVRVIAFPVKHGEWKHAYGYRFESRDRSIVISGDTVATDSVVGACNGCDVLVHEVYAESGLVRQPPEWQRYHRASHTSGVELGRIAAKARPRLLVLTHLLLWGATEEELIAEVHQHFSGEVVLADDLDMY